MLWKEYPRMENEKTKLEELSIEPNSWLITEKVHGCNFCISVKNGLIEFYTRTTKLENDVDFHNFKSANFQFLESLKSLNRDVLIYGELYGARIQKEVFYDKNVNFIAFDVSFENTVKNIEGEEPEEVCKFIPFYEAKAFCESLNIPFVNILYKGTIEQINKFIILELNTFKTTLSTKEIKDIAEGFVIRHEIEHILIKWRTENFREITIKKEPKKKEEKNNKEENNSESAVTPYINKNRLNSVKSKFQEEFIIKNYKIFYDEFLKDVKIDLEKDGIKYEDKYNKEINNFMKESFKKN